jgi:hypothetical protein
MDTMVFSSAGRQVTHLGKRTNGHFNKMGMDVCVVGTALWWTRDLGLFLIPR